MTVCVAALAEQGKSLILVADRMIGYDFVESEPDIRKIIPISDNNWWLMFAGNDISPVFPIADKARRNIAEKGISNIVEVGKEVFDAYAIERDTRAERRFIRPYGATFQDFKKSGRDELGQELFKEIAYKCADYRLGLQLIVAGFDADSTGRISIVDDEGETRQDVPGFATIGSGYTGAQFMLAYRDFSPSMPLREALYYAVEAKYFGEKATGVGGVTDLYIYRPGRDPVTFTDEEIDKQIINKICARLQPRSLETAANASLLNDIQLGPDYPLLVFDKKAKKLMVIQ